MSKIRSALIVDDEPDVIAYVGAVLEGCGFTVHTADSSENGLKIAEKVSPDIICLDIMMPKESGLTMYTKLRANKELAGIPVIIISGIQTEEEFDFQQLVRDSDVPPPEAFFEKPINVSTFEKEVLHIVDHLKAKRARKKGVL